MIRLSVYYPTTEGATFDFDYYQASHIPAVLAAWGLDMAEVDKGVSGPYVAAAHFRFESTEALDRAMSAEGTAGVMADIPNYTTIAPVIQTSEILG
jgi:uncharacterized protein (TIGR02118 family)